MKIIIEFIHDLHNLNVPNLSFKVYTRKDMIWVEILKNVDGLMYLHTLHFNTNALPFFRDFLEQFKNFTGYDLEFHGWRFDYKNRCVYPIQNECYLRAVLP